MSRFLSWLAVGLAAAFLVVADVAFSVSVIAWLAFAIGIGTLAVSANIAYRYRVDLPSVLLGSASALIGGWTIVASLVFSGSMVQSLVLASSVAISGLAVAGLTAHEIEHDYIVSPMDEVVHDYVPPRQREDVSIGRDSGLATAA